MEFLCFLINLTLFITERVWAQKLATVVKRWPRRCDAVGPFPYLFMFHINVSRTLQPPTHIQSKLLRFTVFNGNSVQQCVRDADSSSYKQYLACVTVKTSVPYLQQHSTFCTKWTHHTPTHLCFCHVYLNVIFPFTPWSLKSHIAFRLSNQNNAYIFSPVQCCCTPYSFYFLLFGHPNNIGKATNYEAHH